MEPTMHEAQLNLIGDIDVVYKGERSNVVMVIVDTCI